MNLLTSILIIFGILFSANIPAAEVTVFAAASLTDALKEIAAAYEKESGDRIRFNFAASSLLARQIDEGAPADMFFSADEAKMDALEGKGLILKETRRSRLSNSLVIVVSAENKISLKKPDDLAGPNVSRLALAEPKTVPAGIYAKRFLEQKNLWPAVSRKVIPTENVRAALSTVEAGNADAAIVYKTDAAISKNIRIALEVPSSGTPEISYPLAMIKKTGQRDAAKKFFDHLNSEAAGQVFEKRGFIVKP